MGKGFRGSLRGGEGICGFPSREGIFGFPGMRKEFVGSPKGWEGICGFLRVGKGFGGSHEGLGLGG